MVVSQIDEISAFQKKIDDTNYWDEMVLRIESKYWTDELQIVFGTLEEQQCLIFKGCYKQLFNHASSPKDTRLYHMSVDTPSDYWMQDVTLDKTQLDEMTLIRCKINMAYLMVEIWCKDIEILTISK